VTIFNRGRSAPGMFGKDVEELQGDRAGDLDALTGRRWDAVIDESASTCGTRLAIFQEMRGRGSSGQHPQRIHARAGGGDPRRMESTHHETSVKSTAPRHDG